MSLRDSTGHPSSLKPIPYLNSNRIENCGAWSRTFESRSKKAEGMDMFKAHFGLRENPFNINPDPRYLYVTRRTQEAINSLAYGIEARKGFILLTGEVGTGKT